MGSQAKGRQVSRREFGVSATAASCAVATGCLRPSGPQSGRLEKVWGHVGASAGKFFRPRAIAIDKQDLLYIVDMNARIQVFTGDGELIRHWQTPDFKNGRPSGLSFDNAGNLLVCDTHYVRVLVYTPEGKLLENQQIGGKSGDGDGEFQFVTDAAQDTDGSFYVAQYGEYDRIQKLTADHTFMLSWGEHGAGPGQFLRPQKLVIDKAGLVWVADACNHRVQVFDTRGGTAQLVKTWGEEGYEPGQLKYPYDILLDDAALAGDSAGFVYLCEFGNHRVQKFTWEGEFVGLFGTNGRREGELDQPWGIAKDSRGRMYVLDTYNHRVQRFRL